MKKKESLWDLLKRLDEQAGQFNLYLRKANHYFDTSANATKKIIDKHEKDLHQLIGKVRRALRVFVKNNKKAKKKNK
jgi:hypothetical protein